MNFIKRIVSLTFLGIAFTAQAAELPNANLNKILVYFSKVKNSTKQDLLFVEADKAGIAEKQLFLLNSGKTINNIPISFNFVTNNTKHRIVKIKDSNDNVIAYFNLNYRLYINPEQTASISVGLNTLDAALIGEWEEESSLKNVKRLEVGIALDVLHF